MERNKGVMKYPAFFLLAGVVPIALLFIANASFPDSHLIQSLYEASQGHARSFSEQHQKVSSIASAYTTLVPWLLVILYGLFWKQTGIYSDKVDVKRLVKLFPALLLVVLGWFALSLFGIQNLTTTSKAILRSVADSQVLLFFYYTAVVIGHSFFIWLCAICIHIFCDRLGSKKRA